MALVAQEKDMTLREWMPLTDLLQRLPTKAQSGLFVGDLKLTCVDVLTEFIALGTNAGAVYWYDRRKKDMQRLRCENANPPVTSVKIISTVDYMLAAGCKDGSINIFQIPKAAPDNLPDSLKPKNKQVERYTVSDMHKGTITTLEWSKNGMKLFSGDVNGVVVLTELDFYMHLCKSAIILNEAYEVVQLSYHQQNLLVSTTYRSIVCQKHDKWEVCQVGKKDRKILGKFGGILYQTGLRPTDVILYCSRPGLRIWLSDIKGHVQQTLLFKDLLNQEPPEVPLLNPISANLKRLKPAKEPSFGSIYPFLDDYLVTYNNDVLYILQPKELKVIATISHLRNVLNISVNKDEIFVLEGERSLLRIGFSPEIDEKSACNATSNPFQPFASILELTNKLQSTNIISALPQVFELSSNFQNDEVIVINGEEANEATTSNKYIPPVTPAQNYPEKVYESYRKLEIFNKISEQEFDEAILFKHGKRKKSDMRTSVCSISSNSSDEKDTTIIKPTVMNMSAVGILPDFRSPDSIQTDIEQKEKMLADMLNFDSVKIDLNNLTKKEDTTKSKSVHVDLNNEIDLEDNLNILKSEIALDLKKETDIIERSNETAPLEEIECFVLDEETKLNKIKRFMAPDEIKTNKTDINNEEKLRPRQIDIPGCVHLPQNWNVNTLSLEKSERMAPSSPDSDWELV